MASAGPSETRTQSAWRSSAARAGEDAVSRRPAAASGARGRGEWTPRGPVFLRQSEHNLPDLVAALHSGEINVDLVGRIDTGRGGGIRNTFAVRRSGASSRKLVLLRSKAERASVTKWFFRREQSRSTHGERSRTFVSVPDAPVSSFVLEMAGGARGLLQNSTDICAGLHRAIVDFSGHNGKVCGTEPAVKAKCGAKGHANKGKRHR